MSRIFRGPAALRPLAGIPICPPSLLRYSRSGFPPKYFSQSSKLCARPNRYTPEQLSAFTNHYAILGVGNNAAREDIRKAYISLSKRFHPDMVRNVDDQAYLDNPDRPEFVKLSNKIQNSYELLMDPARRQAFDAVYANIVGAIKQLNAERRAARGVDSKKTIASALRLDHPTASEDGTPVRDHCVVQLLYLPPQVTRVDIARAIAQIGPVGRVIDIRLMSPSRTTVEAVAFVEFANDKQARNFGLLALNNHFSLLGTTVWHCRIVQPLPGQASAQAPLPQATRVLVIDGPRDHKLMTVSAMEEFLDGKFTHMREVKESCTMRESANGPGSATIQCIFTSWRAGARLVYRELSRAYPELTITHGRDPCE